VLYNVYMKSDKNFLDIGIPEPDRMVISEQLEYLLADTYTLYLLTHKYHWNVTGPMFQTLHLMFEEQYNELAMAVDAIAERIRTLGFFVAADYRHFIEMTNIPEDPEVSPDALVMVRRLVQGHEILARTAREVLSVSEVNSDHSTNDLMTQRLNIHEKTAWMLRSLLTD
jgi:starvation-inducible DNA-binding protein